MHFIKKIHANSHVCSLVTISSNKIPFCNTVLILCYDIVYLQNSEDHVEQLAGRSCKTWESLSWGTDRTFSQVRQKTPLTSECLCSCIGKSIDKSGLHIQEKQRDCNTSECQYLIISVICCYVVKTASLALKGVLAAK